MFQIIISIITEFLYVPMCDFQMIREHARVFSILKSNKNGKVITYKYRFS